MTTRAPLRFHWMLPKSGETAMTTPLAGARYRVESIAEHSPAATPHVDDWLGFVSQAEAAGIDSVLISFSRYEPDPMLTACALGRASTRLGFIVAVRSGLLSPTLLVQQVNTLSGMIGGRVAVNLVAGSSRMEQRGYGDFLAHDDRYARAEEFLAICRAAWARRPGDPAVTYPGQHYRIEDGKVCTPFCPASPPRSTPHAGPELYVSGHSAGALRLAAGASCWLRVADRPEVLRDQVARMRAQGVEVCLRLCVLCRPTRAEALALLDQLVADPVVSQPSPHLAKRDDSQMYREAPHEAWLGDRLWTGLARVRGPVWTTLVGTPRQVADALLEYGQIGVTQFILSGWPEHTEVEIFGREVMPLVRTAEAS